MSIPESSSRVRYYGWMLLVLLAAAFMRLHQFIAVPPGLTHDEADHGITAWGIINEGIRDIYFTIGYGREPLYDYITALLMTFLGPTFLAGRITAVYFSLIMIAGMSAWVKRAFDGKAALLTAAGLAVGFWPVMSGRQSLRSILLPALFVLAAALFWIGLERLSKAGSSRSTQEKNPFFLFLIAGIILGLTFYAYIPARALWIIFPALLGYLFITRRPLFKKIWPWTLMMLIVMLIVALPLLLYLGFNPSAEVRIQQLAAPLTAAADGEFDLLFQYIVGSLRLFANEGDMAWRYNIAGKPLLGPLMGMLFFAGVVLAGWYTIKRRNDLQYGAASFLALSWLLVGFLPVLVTGPELSMTQAIGIQPVLYLFPALSLLAVGQISIRQNRLGDSRWASFGLVLLFIGAAVLTYRDYFNTWATSPEVRVQYESTMATAMDYLNEQGEGVVAISSITPDRYHSPALAQMLLRSDGVEARWFDARSSILLPEMESGQIIIPGFTPLAEALEGYFETAVLKESLPLQETDLDRPLDIYTIDRAEMLQAWQSRLNGEEAAFGGAVELLGYEIYPSTTAPGEDVQVVTLWQADQPVEDAVIFIHVVAPEGEPVAQSDQIGVPSYGWQPDDLFLQSHQFTIPADAEAGTYPLAVGVYTAADGARMPINGGDQTGDVFTFANLVVTP